jgi:hypothetical protein
MMRIRRQDGSTLPVQADEAVEILGLDGKLAVVIYTARKGTVKVLVPPDPLFTAYCKSQGLEQAARVNVHPPFDGKPIPLR